MRRCLDRSFIGVPTEFNPSVASGGGIELMRSWVGEVKVGLELATRVDLDCPFADSSLVTITVTRRDQITYDQ